MTNVLTLNADFRPLSYFPLSTMSWQDAVRLVFQQKASIVAEYEREIHSPSVVMRMPSVIALRDYVKGTHGIAFTRFNVFLRDRFTCQYCGTQLPSHALRFDHVHPRSRGGETTWENIAAACETCNSEKGDRTDIKPMRMPYKPTAGELARAQREFPPRYLHESWLDYLYWDAALTP